MKFFRMLGRSIRDAFKSVFRNFSLSLASISCIIITLLIVAVAIILTFNVENFTKEMEKDLTIVVFLNNNATEEQVKDVQNKLEKMDNVESLTYQSKNAVKEEMRKENEVFNEVMSTWKDNDNPLKDTFQVKVKDVEKIKTTAEKIKKMEQVSVVNYGEAWVDKMISMFSVVEKGAYGVVIALILVTVFLIVNTIKLTIFSRKREIEIMRLVGASNVSIKVPFVIEGLFIGMLGSIIPIILSVYGYTSLYNFFKGKLFGSSLAKLVPPTPFMYYISLVLLAIGIVVGMIGSYRAVRKYLKI